MTWLSGGDLARPTTMSCDVAVVGSGPAGATVARALASAGLRVLVLEAGPRVLPAQFERSAFGSMAATYRGLGATAALGAAPTPLVQGRMVGGSSPVNGAICWRLPRDVYDEWCGQDDAVAHGLPWPALEAATDEIEARLGVAPTDPAVAGPKNLLMARGAEALGLEHRPIRRNVRDCRGLGRCMQGCPEGHKQSVDLTLLGDAVQHGATVLSDAEVVELTVSRGRARGLQARTMGGARLTVQAGHAVVLAASAVQTPALLLRSGLRQGPVGHGFQGHPGVSMAGRFLEPVRMWEGATQGHEVIGLRHEGLKFEALGFDLTILAARLPGWGRAFADRLPELPHWVEWGVAVRSRTRGRVFSVLGRTVVRWSPSPRDLAQYRRGLRVLGELMLAAGAVEVAPGVRGAPPLLRDLAGLRALEQDGPRGAAAYPAVITHMFGTCRLGRDPRRSVVRPDLRHHHVDGLYVADSSVFPTNLGVNPQVPIMAVAALCARHVQGLSPLQSPPVPPCAPPT